MKTHQFALAFLISAFSKLAVAAADVRLYEWRPTGSVAPLILPVKEGEAPEAAALRYLSNLERSPDLMELFQGLRPDLSIENFRPLQGDRETRALLLANLPKDTGSQSGRVNNFKKILGKGGQESYILPINANLGLTIEETRSMFNKISEQFPMMVALGGDDVEPSLYKKDNYHSRNTILTRDKFEASLIKYYVASERGFMLAVCRGSQLTSVALGYSLLQDVPVQVGPEVAHANDWHDINIQPTTNNILSSLLPEGSDKLLVNSFHHQAVQFKPGGLLEIAATAPDGVTEATEFKNGRGLLLQFHPELMENSLGQKIIWRAVQQKQKVMIRSCGKIFG